MPSSTQRTLTSLTLTISLVLLIWGFWPGGHPVTAQQPPAGNKVTQTPANLFYTNTSNVTCSATSSVLKAASTSPTEVTMIMPDGADTGIRIQFSAAATGSSTLIPASKGATLSTKQEIRCIRAGSVDVVVGLLVSTSAP